MKIICTFLIAMFCITFASNAEGRTASSKSTESKEDGWLQNGKSVPSPKNIKSKNEFGAQLWIINDESFFDDWKKPETPYIPATKTAIRNKPVFIILLFVNPGLDSKSRANVTADFTIISPDGKVYGEFKDVEIWQGKNKVARNYLQLATSRFGIKIEDDELLGTYKVEAKIKDHIKNIVLELKTEFTAKEQ